jgi:hypothetical protein
MHGPRNKTKKNERRLLYVISKLCLRFSTIVCDTQFTLILFFLSFFWANFQFKRTTRAEPEDHLWSADHSLRNIALGYTTNFNGNVTNKFHILPVRVVLCFVVTTCFGLHSYHQGSYYRVIWRYSTIYLFLKYIKSAYFL